MFPGRNEITLALVAILGIWLVLSALRYVPHVEQWIVSWDALYLTPQWNFFAPNPNRMDYYLYARVEWHSVVSPWRELALAPDRGRLAMIWNPGRRNRKAFIDLCQSFSRRVADSREEILLSIPYLLVLNFVSHAYAKTPGDLIQFAICTCNPNESPEEVSLLFLSEFHMR